MGNPELYMGNPNLKASQVNVQFTEEQVKEYIKCAKDPVYFINNYVKVVSLDHGLVPFKLYPYQERIIDTVHKNRFTIGKLFRQAGKALPLDTRIPTPKGFVTMGDLEIGDEIYDHMGRVVKVVAVTDPKPLKMYRMTFDTGETVVSCKDHHWHVMDRINSRVKVSKGKYDHAPRVMTTEEMYNSRWRSITSRGKYTYAYYIPNTKPFVGEKVDLPIDPYILGAWLGDGSSADNRFTTHISNMEYFKSRGIELVLTQCSKKKGTDTYTARVKGLETKDLRMLGVLNHKHIPQSYLFASLEQRLQLLQGLMDTDGFVSKRGDCSLSFSAKEKYADLVETVHTLLCSLGLKVVKRYKASTNSYTFRFQAMKDTFPLPIVTLPSKYERLKDTADTSTYKRYMFSRSIVNIEPIEGETLGKCIQVDNEEHMFLCTERFIPTGNSTVMAAYMLWYVCFNPYKNAMILSNKFASARDIFSRVAQQFEDLPMWLKPGVTSWNKTSFTLENHSSASCAATSPSAVRGRSCNLLLLDEFGFVPAGLADEFIASVFPTLSSSRESKLVLISTPNGIGNAFYKIWHDSETGANDFKRIEGHWSEIHDQKWYDEQCKVLNNDKTKIAAELDTLFLGSSHTLIDPKVMKSLVFDNPLQERNNVRFFEMPQQGHSYVMTVDVARGHKRDFSAFAIIDVTEMPFKVVATFKDNEISPEQLATVINEIGHIYGEATILVESNDLGESVGSNLWYDFEYGNMIWTDSKHDVASKGYIGVRTTKSVKARGLAVMKTLIEQGMLLLRDNRILQELEVYSLQKKGQYGASDTKINDDLCACLFLFGWLTEQPYFGELSQINTFSEIKSKFQSSIEDYVPFGFVVNSRDAIDVPRLTEDEVELLGTFSKKTMDFKPR